MIPIRDLLNRLRWDPSFAAGAVELGLWDRRAGELLRVPLQDVAFEEGHPFFLSVVDARGIVRSVPLHRVRRVWRNGELLWSRDARARGE